MPNKLYEYCNSYMFTFITWYRNIASHTNSQKKKSIIFEVSLRSMFSENKYIITLVFLTHTFPTILFVIVLISSNDILDISFYLSWYIILSVLQCIFLCVIFQLLPSEQYNSTWNALDLLLMFKVFSTHFISFLTISHLHY